MGKHIVLNIQQRVNFCIERRMSIACLTSLYKRTSECAM